MRNIVGTEYEVAVMHKSGSKNWKWPIDDDIIYYNASNIVKVLNPPEVVNSRGQFMFKDL